MKRVQFRWVILVLVVVFGAISLYGWVIASRGFSAKTAPTSAEEFVARRLRRLAMPSGASDAKNPVQLSPEVLSAGMAHWADHCATCHGNDGRGSTLIGRGLYPKPPDMTGAATQQLTDGELYYIIENGIRFTGMPAFGEETIEAPGDQQDAESWHLVHFIRYLPKLTEDELVEMKKMNPKSPTELAREERMRRFLQGDDSQPAENSHEHHH
jgi:mono/diheme cytochrome c family protein